MPPHRLPLLAVVFVLAALVVPATAPAAGVSARASTLGLPVGQTLLFAVHSNSGRLVPRHGSRTHFVLTLRGASAPVVWFADRPRRDAGQIPARRFFAAWKALGFADDPPNALISVAGAPKDADMLAVELGRPVYSPSRHTLRIPARRLSNLPSRLGRFGGRVDRRLPRHFGAVSLFVDTATPDSPDCGYTGEVDYYVTGLTPAETVPADGRVMPIADAPSLAALLGKTYGGDGVKTFGLPKVPSPVTGVSAYVCALGEDPHTPNGFPSCTTGQLQMFAFGLSPSGYVPADGRTVNIVDQVDLFAAIGNSYGGNGYSTMQVPNIPATAGVGWQVCAGGDPRMEEINCLVSELDLYSLKIPDPGVTSFYGAKPIPNDPQILPADGGVYSDSSKNAEGGAYNIDALGQIIGSTFGGNGNTTVGVPDMPAPPQTAWGMCSVGWMGIDS